MRYKVWVQNKIDTFSFSSPSKPDLINFDGDKILLCTKKENKNLGEYVFQYNNAGTYLDRREAIDFASKHQDDPKAVALLKTALKDKYDGLRNFTIARLDMKNKEVKAQVEPVLLDLAKNDPKRRVKASAIGRLGLYKKPEYESLFKTAVNDSSYSVSGSALDALYEIDSATAYNEARRLSQQPSKGKLAAVIASVTMNESAADSMLKKFESMPLSQNKFNMLQSITDFLSRTKNMTLFKRGIDDIVTFRDAIPETFKGQTDPVINGVLLKGLASKKMEDGLTEQSDYVISKLPAEDKKGF
ncbi:MAG TPA: HEAT repeat domain-containing protein [Chitinophagaceae bacterium]